MPGFARRRHATLREGRPPSAAELLLGMPFLGGSLRLDAADHARHCLRTLSATSAPGTGELRAALVALAADPATGTVRAVLESLPASLPEARGSHGSPDGWSDTVHLRCRIYLAHLGDAPSFAYLAGEAALVAWRAARVGVASAYTWRALALAVVWRRLMDGGPAAPSRGGAMEEVDGLARAFGEASRMHGTRREALAGFRNAASRGGAATGAPLSDRTGP